MVDKGNKFTIFSIILLLFLKIVPCTKKMPFKGVRIYIKAFMRRHRNLHISLIMETARNRHFPSDGE